MTSPACRIFTLSKAARGGPIEHDLDSATDAGCRLWFCGPDRLKSLQYERDIDRADGQIAERRIGVGRERVDPLIGMLRVFPTRLMRGDVALGALAKADLARGLYPRSHTFRQAGFDRIDAIKQPPPTI